MEKSELYESHIVTLSCVPQIWHNEQKGEKKKKAFISLQEAGAEAGALQHSLWQLGKIKRRLSASLEGTSTALRTRQGPAEIWRGSRAAVVVVGR